MDRKLTVKQQPNPQEEDAVEPLSAKKKGSEITHNKPCVTSKNHCTKHQHWQSEAYIRQTSSSLSLLTSKTSSDSPWIFLLNDNAIQFFPTILCSLDSSTDYKAVILNKMGGRFLRWFLPELLLHPRNYETNETDDEKIPPCSTATLS